MARNTDEQDSLLPTGLTAAWFCVRESAEYMSRLGRFALQLTRWHFAFLFFCWSLGSFLSLPCMGDEHYQDFNIEAQTSAKEVNTTHATYKNHTRTTIFQILGTVESENRGQLQ